MRKKVLAMALTTVLAVSVLAGCSGGNDQAPAGEGNTETVGKESSNDQTAQAGQTGEVQDELYEVVMAYAGTPQDGLQRIQDRINEIAEKEINMHVKLMPISWGDYGNTINLMLSSGEDLDIFNILGGASGFVEKGQVVDLAPLLDQYGTNIIKTLGKDMAYSSLINGTVYGVITNRDQAQDMSLVMRKDICDKYGISADMIKNVQDIGTVLAIVKEKEPGMIPLASYQNSTPLSKIGEVDYLDDWFGVLLNNGIGTTEVVNWFETPEFEKSCQILRDWNLAGYFSSDAATNKDSLETQMKAGNVFSFISNTKPGFDIQTKSATGYEVICAPFTDVTTSTTYTGSFNYAIAQNSRKPEKAMQFLDWAYGSPEFNNLICYGEEGTDWKFVDKEAGVVTYADGQTADSASYHEGSPWEMPNQQLAYVWEGNDPQIWEKLDAFNKSAKKSDAFGFIYDASNVSSQLTALNNVRDQYFDAFGTGSLDLEEYLPKLRQALKAAGIDDVIAEKQAQLDKWLAERK